MENLSLHDQNVRPQGAPMLGQPQPSAQLPPQMFTTAASLLDLTDKKLMVALRDGRKIIGVLRSWDQFGNLVLQNSVERTFAGKKYADMERGIYLVRGENVLLMGEIDLDKDDYIPEPYEKGTPAEVFEMLTEEKEQTRRLEGRRLKRLKDMGFEVEHSGEAIL